MCYSVRRQWLSFQSLACCTEISVPRLYWIPSQKEMQVRVQGSTPPGTSAEQLVAWAAVRGGAEVHGLQS